MWGTMCGVNFVSYVDQHLRKLLINFCSGEVHKITLAWIRIVGPGVTRWPLPTKLSISSNNLLRFF